MNPRPSPWQGDALPLSYSRECFIIVTRTDLSTSKTKFFQDLLDFIAIVR